MPVPSICAAIVKCNDVIYLDSMMVAIYIYIANYIAIYR